jgi:hypothetical protein
MAMEGHFKSYPDGAPLILFGLPNESERRVDYAVEIPNLGSLILKHDPNSTCHRVGGSVDPFKARSGERMQRLETARQLLLIMPEWESCFDRPFFPQFATRSGFS